jgi:long-chain acyl-CoA synthetase
MLHSFMDLLLHIDKEFGALPAFRIRLHNKMREISYHKFVRDVRSLYRWMIIEGYSGKHIGLLSKNGYEWIVWYFAAITSGAVAVPINRGFTMETVKDIIEDYDLYALLYDGEEIEWTNALEGNGILTLDMNHLPKCNEAVPYIQTDPDTTACIILTSGTTGISKGVMLSQRNLLSAYQKRDRDGGMSTLLLLPFHHIAGVGYIVENLIRGNCAGINQSIKHMVSDLLFFKPEEVLMVPGIVEMLTDMIGNTQKKAVNDNLRRLVSCGAPLRAECQIVLREYGIELWQVYGLTETSGMVTLCDCEQRQGVVGKLQEWNSIEIENGEIKIKGNNVMLGYYKDFLATREVLRNEWLSTGDLGFLDENGFLHINGRKKNLIILSNGENISPEELEYILGRGPYIQEVLVKSDEDKICAEIWPIQSMNLTVEFIQNEISSFIRDINMELPTFQQIRKYFFREVEFEKTASGKIKR